MEYSLFSSGKRIRPILSMAVCEALGEHATEVLPFASAIELIHTYSLIHDDLPAIDNDDLRRGQPTCHKVFGEPLAILAGDALLTEAFNVSTDPRFVKKTEAAIVQKAVNEIAFAAGANGMVGGQVMDVLSDGKKGSKKILHYIHTRKTMALIRVSVRLGAIIEGSDEGQLAKMTCYGESIGLAFQIVDDLLDVLGDEKKVGKRLRKDITKQTYIKHFGIDGSRKRIAELTETATESIDFLGRRGQVLSEIATFIANRVS